READTLMSTERHPKRMSESLLREVKFAIAMVHATEQGTKLEIESEVRHHLAQLDSLTSAPPLSQARCSAVGMSAPVVANLLGLDGRDLGVPATALAHTELPAGSIAYWSAQEGARLLARMEHERLFLRSEPKARALHEMLEPATESSAYEPSAQTRALYRQRVKLRRNLLERVREHCASVGHGHRLDVAKIFDASFAAESKKLSE
ncbi:MAG: hypothetical protein AAF658_10725, partial [Myxococcota bacterium]